MLVMLRRPTRRVALRALAVLGLASLPAQVRVQAPPHFDMERHAKVLAFEKAWDPWIRKFYGCDPGPAVFITPETCQLALTQFDAQNWSKARDAAKILFDLAEKE